MNVKSLSIVAGLIATLGSSAALAADLYTSNQNYPTTAASTAPRVAAVPVAALDEYQGNRNIAAVVSSDMRRAQVLAEAKEARKLGLITEGERQAPSPTAVQAEQIRLAGLNAVHQQVAMK